MFVVLASTGVVVVDGIAFCVVGEIISDVLVVVVVNVVVFVTDFRSKLCGCSL